MPHTSHLLEEVRGASTEEEMEALREQGAWGGAVDSGVEAGLPIVPRRRGLIGWPPLLT
jgi:hypothetical protein